MCSCVSVLVCVVAAVLFRGSAFSCTDRGLGVFRFLIEGATTLSMVSLGTSDSGENTGAVASSDSKC